MSTSNREGFTLLEVLVASVIAAGSLAILGMWGYKQPWNQVAKNRLQAQLVLEKGMQQQFKNAPFKYTENVVPLDGGCIVTWKWNSLPSGGWCLKGEVFDARGKSLGTLVGARWH